ncbi:sulfatase-like hydrolase/transferase [Flavobacterium sp. DG1-102-2]|uniref:LTA synthase family protein n=1 Tax=Flavobacterium sp. DG1-102-2 TaxID=3081663 RepID=UPI002949EB9F|nr:sulfatase-like hydrolase/transferase [Flavobacterium sp. DG1-102-2]MDV6167446.1 sulfatase-like hydrolase/transferase [Flavobacterium sp. DG1-102-2]
MKIKGSFKYQLQLSGRLSLLLNFIKLFILLSLLLRILFYFWQSADVSFNPISIIRTFVTGLFFDMGTCSFIVLPAMLYIFIMPNRFIGSWADKLLTYIFFTLTVFILMFTFLAEITFWEEFRTRFNFIAVDYLIYTHEVISNIKESYPLPLLVSLVLLATAGVVVIFVRKNIFKDTFSGGISLRQRIVSLGLVLTVMFLFIGLVKNTDAEWSANRYNNEISKAGIYSFFAEFRNNRMDYADFYTTLNDKEAFTMARNNVHESNTHFNDNSFSIKRKVNEDGIVAKPNVVFILMESMSASFMHEFGNEKNITPYMDSLAQRSILFSNLYATGTRTVRGMEAVTLCIPPTPGQSIVKRPDNHNLFTVSTVFKNRGYDNNFFYGGDGYFDNMNSYFGGNGFTIYDRGRGSVLNDDIKTPRNTIDDKEVTFENAWGVCDEDIYNKMLTVADKQYKAGKPFFNFVMTTSNHRPYTYPDNKIDIQSGTGREGAVKYADFALGKMLETARTKPWFKNTVFVIIADHCASSAGKDEIDVANYHIPAFIYNLPGGVNQKINRQCSQIDLFPTFFSLMNWDYESNFFGKDVLQPDFTERTLMGTYRKLTLMKQDKVMILSDQKKQNFYSYSLKDNSLKPQKMEKGFLNEAISWYQTADYLFSHKLLKE